MRNRTGLRRLLLAIGAALALSAFCAAPVAAQGGVIVAGTLGEPEKDLTPEQEQRLLGEYWTVAKRYSAEPARTITEMSAWTRDRIGKVQSIQYQPEGPRPDYLESRAEWKAETLRVAAMLHSDIALAHFQKRALQDFEFHVAIADGWLALADNRKSAPGSLRSRWNVTIARLLLASGETGLAERHLVRLNERITGDPGILLAYATVKETQAGRLVAEGTESRLDDPARAAKARDAALQSAAAMLDRAMAAEPTLVEARLRRAHVDILMQEGKRAEALLGSILAAAPPPATKYLASLMLGGIRERAGQLEQAARTYVEAILAVPDGQSAYLALSHVMQRMNQPGDAAAVLDRLFGRAITSLAADPWWTYPLGLDLALDARFEEYRALVRK